MDDQDDVSPSVVDDKTLATIETIVIFGAQA